jgi:hypothetical protein
MIPLGTGVGSAIELAGLSIARLLRPETSLLPRHRGVDEPAEKQDWAGDLHDRKQNSGGRSVEHSSFPSVDNSRART